MSLPKSCLSYGLILTDTFIASPLPRLYDVVVIPLLIGEPTIGVLEISTDFVTGVNEGDCSSNLLSGESSN
jgi:hypothetical protein